MWNQRVSFELEDYGMLTGQMQRRCHRQKIDREAGKRTPRHTLKQFAFPRPPHKTATANENELVVA